MHSIFLLHFFITMSSDFSITPSIIRNTDCPTPYLLIGIVDNPFKAILFVPTTEDGFYTLFKNDIMSKM